MTPTRGTVVRVSVSSRRFAVSMAVTAALLLAVTPPLIAQSSPQAEPQSVVSPKRPNIIVVMADDMGFSDLSCYGGEIPTPAIDRLAREGIRFSHFYNSAICGPSRAALMTGCHAWRVGQRRGANIFADLTGNCATVMELLKENGYETCVVGRLDMVTVKWNNPAQIPGAASRYLGSPSGGPGHYYEEVSRTPWFKDGARYERAIGEYSTDLTTSFVTDFIKGTAGGTKPFFLYYSHYAPHWPLQADEKDIAPFRKLYKKADRAAIMTARLQRLVEQGLIPKGTTLLPSMLHATDNITVPQSERLAINAAMVASIDQSVAAIMTALEKAGQLENTLILVLSDNGADGRAANAIVPKGARIGGAKSFIYQGPAVASVNNTPFKSFKGSEYEGGIASPLIAWWPKGLKAPGRLSHRPTHLIDIMPTCLELAGVTYPNRFRDRTLIPLDGQSLLPILRDRVPENEAPRVLAWPTAVREGNWKLVLKNPARPELYDLENDRNETLNRASELPEKIKRLLELHAAVYP